MATTRQQIESSLEGMLHGASLDQITNIDEAFRRAANTFLAKTDPPETKRISQITTALYDDIYDYTCPSDLKGRKVIDIRPQVNRGGTDSFIQRGAKEFDLRKQNNTFQIDYDDGVKTLRLSKSLTGSIKLHECDSITANGTWAVGNDAKNLTLDNLNYVSGSGSLNFDLTGSAVTASLVVPDMAEVDLSEEEDISPIFIRVYLPAPTLLTSIELRWGSSASAYWSNTATTPHDATAFKVGWNTVKFEWNGATKTGSPDSSAIDYIKPIYTYSSAVADTDLRLDKISCHRGKIWEIAYYSECLFQTNAGVWQPTTESGDDIIHLDEDGIQLYTLEVLIALAQQLQGTDSAFDINWAKEELKGDGRVAGLYQKYNKSHPSEALDIIEIYYRHNIYGG